MDTIFTFIKDIGSMFGAITACIICIGLILKIFPKTDAWVSKLIEKKSLTKEQNNEILELDKKINQNKIDLEDKINKSYKELNERIDKTYGQTNQKLDKLINLLDCHSQQLEVQKQGFVCLLAKNLKVMCQDIIDKNSFTEDEYKDITLNHKVYKKSGGNGYIDAKIHQALPDYKYNESDNS